VLVSLLAIHHESIAASQEALQSLKLDVRAEPSGGMRATAELVIPAPPLVVQGILTDYAKWPELFEVKMRLAHLEQRDGRAITDFYIKHTFLSGERRLLCESKTLPDGGLVTTLLGGNFKQYHRTWKFNPAKDGRWTRAEFQLIVEVDSLAPDWLFAMTLKQELRTHFRRLTEKAVELATQEN
jgi:hypothetical protein